MARGFDARNRFRSSKLEVVCTIALVRRFSRATACLNLKAHADLALRRVWISRSCLSSGEAISELSADLGVEALPAFRFYKEGEEVVEPVMGYKKKQLRAAVESLQRKA